jgi:hypothetical protein
MLLIAYIGLGVGHFVFHNPDAKFLFNLLTAIFVVSITVGSIEVHFHLRNKSA